MPSLIVKTGSARTYSGSLVIHDEGTAPSLLSEATKLLEHKRVEDGKWQTSCSSQGGAAIEYECVKVRKD